MGDLGADVDAARRTFERIEVLPEGLPLPRQPFREGGARDVFDAFHQFDKSLSVLAAARREADTAVAHDHRGDAVGDRWLQLSVPGDLPVIMGVDVDKPGCDERAVRVDLTLGLGGDLADFDDSAVFDGDVTRTDLPAGTVGDPPALDDGVVHDWSPLRFAHATSTAPDVRHPLTALWQTETTGSSGCRARQPAGGPAEGGLRLDTQAADEQLV